MVGRRRLRTAFLVVSLVTLPPLCASACSQVEKLSLQLSWVNSAEFAGFVVPTTGLTGVPQYSDECLKVQVREGGPIYDPLQELEEDNADVALCEGAFAAQKISMGSDYTIIASFYQLSSLALVGLNKKFLSSMQDLRLKRIGLRRQGYDLPVKLMLKNSKVTQVGMTFMNQSTSNPLRELKEASIDVATATLYRDAGEVMQWLNPSTHYLRQEEELAVFNTANYSAPALHNVLVVKTAKLPSLRPKLVKFLKVAAKVWIYCRDNEESCLKAWPHSSPLQRRLLRESLKLIFPSSNFGVLSASTWTAINGSLVAAGLIPSRTTSAIDNSLIVEAAGSLRRLSSNQPTGSSRRLASAADAYSPGNILFCAPYNSVVKIGICTGQEHLLCKQGYAPSVVAVGTCVACAPGRFSWNAFTAGPSRMNDCMPCAAGRYAANSGQRECTACGVGKFRSLLVTSGSNISASELAAFSAGTGCAKCAPGRSARLTGMSGCDLCARGHYAINSASSSCARCSDGSYAASHGMSECTACPHNTSTRGHGASYIYECSCGPDTYRNSNGNCMACPEGFHCPVGSDEAVLRSFGTTGYVSGQYPHLLPGYWASRADPLSVYLCHNAGSCPGGVPQACGEFMEDIGCSLCQKGYYRQGRTCESCTGTDSGNFNYPTLPIVFGPIVIIALYYYMWDEAERWGSYANELWSVAFLLIVHYQIVGLVVGASVPWPSHFFGTLYVWEYLVDFSNMLRLDCIDDSQTYRGFKDGYLVKAMQPLILMLVSLIVYGAGVGLAAIGLLVRRTGQKWLDGCFKSCGLIRFTKGDPKTTVDPGVLFNNYMAIFQTFYISACFISLEMFMCYAHPNGKTMLRFGANVECFSWDWQQLIGEAVLIMIPICGAVGGLVFVAIVAPKFFNRKSFRVWWKFLLIKWRPDVWWWGAVVLIRALLLCLTHIVSQEGQSQLLWQLAILLTYAGCTAVARPWRSWCANVLDLEVCSSLVLFIALCCNFVVRSNWLDDSVAHFARIIMFAAAVAFILVTCWVVYYGLGKLRVPWDRKLADDAQAAFAKFVGLDKKAAETFVTKLSGQDCMALRRFWFMITVELLEEPGGSRHHNWLIKQKTPNHKIVFAAGPRPAALEEEDLATLFDPGDIVDGTVEQSKWGMNPPKRIPPILASQGISENSTLTGASNRSDTTKASSTKSSERETEPSQTPSNQGSARQPNVSSEGMPAGWRSSKDDNGRTYYYNISNPKGTTTWSPPEGSKLDAGAGVGDVTETNTAIDVARPTDTKDVQQKLDSASVRVIKAESTSKK